MKYVKGLIYFFVPFILLLILSSTLDYFDIISSNIIKYVNFVNIMFSSLICNMFIGRHSLSKGYIEGIKEGFLLVFILFVFTYLAFGKGINLERGLLYLITFVSSIMGSIIGINRIKEGW